MLSTAQTPRITPARTSCYAPIFESSLLWRIPDASMLVMSQCDGAEISKNPKKALRTVRQPIRLSANGATVTSAASQRGVAETEDKKSQRLMI